MHKCLNCGEELKGEYCYNCGQKAEVKRYSFKTLFDDIFGSLLDLDSTSVVKTFKLLATKPGAFIQSYLSGKRIDYLSPFKYLFIMLTLNIAVTWIMHKPAIEPAKVSYSPGEAHMSTQEINLIINFILIVAMIPFAAGMKIVNRKYTLLEYYVFLIYLHSQSILFFIILQLVLFALNITLPGASEGITWFALFTGLYVWGFFTFFIGPVKKILLNLFASYFISILIIVIFIFSGRLLI